MKTSFVKLLIRNSAVAAIYFVLTLFTFPISFGLIQIRLAEILVILCFFNPQYAIGITIGCLLANIFGPGNLGILDITFGTLATFLSCIGISLFKHLAFALIPPILINAFVVGTIIYIVSENVPYFMAVGFVAIGETIAMLIGYLIFMIFRKNKKFLVLIQPIKNVNYKW